jgi:hypothetical protein
MYHRKNIYYHFIQLQYNRQQGNLPPEKNSSVPRIFLAHPHKIANRWPRNAKMVANESYQQSTLELLVDGKTNGPPL